MEEYFELFAQRDVSLDGDVYYCMPEAQVEQIIHDESKKRFIRPMAGEKLTFMDLYEGGERARLDKYIKVRDDKIKAGQLASHDAFVCDLDHNADVMSRCGNLLPCFITHGTLHSWQKKRPLFADECLAAQGFTVYHFQQLFDGDLTGGGSVNFVMPFNLGLWDERQKFEWCGNGMHLATVGSFIAYNMATVERKPDLVAMQVKSSSDDDDEQMELLKTPDA